MRLRVIIFLIIVSNSILLLSQKLEFFGGLNNNIFHDYEEQYVHNKSVYNSDYGYNLGFGIDSIKIDWIKFRFTLFLDNYSGKLNISEGGLGGGSTTIANVEKYQISFGIYPINIRILKRINLNIGLIISRLINESFNGTSGGWAMEQPNWSYNLQDKYNRYSSLTYFGFQGRIAYDFKISKSIWISPQYLYYFGLSNEFVESPEDTKSMRNYFCIGIKKKIK